MLKKIVWLIAGKPKRIDWIDYCLTIIMPLTFFMGFCSIVAGFIDRPHIQELAGFLFLFFVLGFVLILIFRDSFPRKQS